MKIIRKLRNIVEGWTKVLLCKENPQVRERRHICRNCPAMKRILWQDVCTDCGCFLNAKTRVEDEQCPRGRW